MSLIFLKDICLYNKHNCTKCTKYWITNLYYLVFGSLVNTHILPSNVKNKLLENFLKNFLAKWQQRFQIRNE